MKRTRTSQARAGFTLVELLVVIAIIGVLIALLLPAVQSAREAARRTQCQNVIKQLGLAALNHESAKHTLPSSTRPPSGSAGTQRIGAFTYLLPYLEEQRLYDKYDFTLQWSATTGKNGANLSVTSVVLPQLLCPSDPADQNRLDADPSQGTGASWNPIVACSDYGAAIGVHPDLGPASMTLKGKDSSGAASTVAGKLGLVDAETISWDFANKTANSGLLRKNATPRLRDASDGLSKTILFGESAGRPYVYQKGKLVSSDLIDKHSNGAGWCRTATDVSLHGSTRDGTGFSASATDTCPLNCTNGIDTPNYPDAKYNTEGTNEFYSFHSGGANFVFADGSVHFIADTIALKELAKLISRNDALDIAPGIVE